MANAKIIGIDASRAVGRTRTGTENYSWQLIRTLMQEPVDFRWRLYTNGTSEPLADAIATDADLLDIPSRRLWTHVRLSRELVQHRISGLFVPSHVVPLYHPPSVVTIHDLGYLHWPEAHPKNQVRMLDWTTRWSEKVARHIIVPSQQTADDLMRFYRTPASKISVIYHGVDPRMSPIGDGTDVVLRDHYGLVNPFVLAVGTIQPRKNLPILAQAIQELDGVDLVIAGKHGWMADQVMSEIDAAGLGDRLRVLNYVPDDDLPALYRAAAVFAQPSRFEGFGMPILEAMACGTPVMVARGSSLDEVGGEAALRFDHDNVPELTDQLSTLLHSDAAREHAVSEGIAWAGQFNWQQTALKTRIVLEENLIS
ncbi:MAG: glycosyltransferase family 4 protein [Thermomicrobiales bacterium]|nr:glycosyltransferase family 4 protein [Thermomicrobiales bacterium]